MKRIMTSLFILSLVLLTACFGGKGDNAKEVTYDGQIAKLQKDIIEYQNSTKRAGEKEFKMYGEGIYINILAEDNVEDYEGWYFYSTNVIAGTDTDAAKLKELVKLVSVAGPEGRVYTVFGDNYVGLFEYKGIADTKTNGKAFETVLKEDQKIGAVTEDGKIEEVAAGDIVPQADKKASVTSKLAYDVTKSAITFTYKDNLITEAAVTIKDGEKVITTNAAITAKDRNATIAAITLPATIGKETVYTLSSKDIIFGENNIVTVDAKDYPVIEKAESVDTKTVKLTLKDAYTIEELTKQAITVTNTKEGSTEAAIELVVSAVSGKEVTLKTTSTAAAVVLVDAATYAVTSEFFVGEDITFVAKVAAAKYTVVEQTQVAIAGATDFYFGLVNQYGEKVEAKTPITAPKVELKINGIVQTAPTVSLELGFVEVTTPSVKVGDELKFVFSGATYAEDEVGLEYVVIKAAEGEATVGDVTRSEDITLTADKLTADKLDVAAGESITFTATGYDAYGAPVELTTSKIIWTIDGTTISEVEGVKLSANTLEYKFTTPGTYEIRVSMIADTKINKTVTVTVGDAKLSSITLTKISIDKDGKITEGAYPTKIESKEGKIAVLKVTGNSEAALLALDELAITVKEATNEIVAADLGITKELSVDGKSVIVSIAPTKVGKFKLNVKATRDDVEVEKTSDEIETTQVTTVAAITLATKATEDVASVTVKANDTLNLKKGNTLELEMVLFNKHGEEIKGNAGKITNDDKSVLSKTHNVEASKLVIAEVGHKTITSGAIINTISITTDTTENAEFEVKFTKDDVEFKFNVDAYLPKVTSIDTIGDIVAAKALVAGEGTKYHVVKFLDQDGDAIAVEYKELAEVAVTKDNTDATGFTVNFAKNNPALTTAAVWLDKAGTDASNDNDVVTGLTIDAASGVEAGEYTVTLEVKDVTPKITKTFKVNVGADRKVDSIKILTDEKVINLADGATATIQFELLDQYGKAVTGDEKTKMSAKLGANDFTTSGGILEYDEDEGVYSIELTGGASGNVNTDANGNLVVTYTDTDKDISVTSAAIKVNYVEAAAIKSINILAKTEINSKPVTISALDVINAAQNVALTATTLDKDGKDGKEIKWADNKQPAHLKWEVVEAKDADGGSMNLSKFSFENDNKLEATLKLVSEPNYTVKVKVSVTDGETTPTVYASKEITFNVDNNVNLLADKVVIDKVVTVDGSINALVVEKDGVKSIEVEAGKKFALSLKSEDQFGNVKAITMKEAEDNEVATAEKLVVKEIVKDKYIVSTDIDDTTESLVIQTNGNYVGTSTLKVTFLDANGTEVEKTFSIEVLEKVEAYAKANTATADDVIVVKEVEATVAVSAKDQFGNDITALKFVDAIEIYNNGVTAEGKGKAAAVAAIGDKEFAVVKVTPKTENKYTIAVDGTDIKVTGGGSANDQEDCKITILDKNGDTFELVFKVTVTD